ncbi:MAG: amidohydrolase [Gemmatimonadales bacterium]|nr:MAG: amidohydrolase [Gemmatimonadales bacterium]
MTRSLSVLLFGGLLTAGCATSTATPGVPPTPEARLAGDPFPSTYAPLPSRPTLIRDATVLTAAGPRLEHASVLMQDGKIVAVGPSVTAPVDVLVVDGTGKWVTPGLIDSHSHLGVYPTPGGSAVSDGNESTSPNTAQVWAEHSVWPQDQQFDLARAGGITAMQILPGSANLIGGRGVTLKNVPARTVQGMKFPRAPHGLKMACGENPKRVYGRRTTAPSTRMGNVAGYRAAWISAAKYRDAWKRWRAKGADSTAMPDRDLKLETLALALEGDILVHVHCYRADEMAVMIDIAKEFGYRIASFHHGVEAYKVRDLLAAEGICGSLWADWWGFKLEAYDGINENLALVDDAGACAIVHSDSPSGIQRLNQEAAKAMTAGRAAGIDVTYEKAIRWITLNPAKAIGIDSWTGSLEPGKNADVVVWTGDPFSVYSRAEKLYLDGALLYDLNDPSTHHKSDFFLGQPVGEVAQ